MTHPLVEPPAGEVTLMFTDIEGSAKQWDRYHELFRAALEIHNRYLHGAISKHRGYLVKTIGDCFMAAFSSAIDAAECALEIQSLIENEPFPEIGGMRVRIGIHTGELTPTAGDYFGTTVNHAARIETSGHGGQTVLSERTAFLISEQLRPGVTLTDMGLHRLKDLGSPIRLFTLSSTGLPGRVYPPLRTLDLYRNNFPAELTPFFGREREISEINTLLAGSRRLHLSGEPGIGKTRLALQVAAESVHRHPDGICFLERSASADFESVLERIADSLQLPPTFSSSGERTREFLVSKRVMLIFDDCDFHLSEDLFPADFLESHPGLVVLSTGVSCLERGSGGDYPVGGLELPAGSADLNECLASPSIRLFVSIAQSLRSSFQLTAENLPCILTICRFCNGAPLEIETTAKKIRGMTPQQIVSRLK